MKSENLYLEEIYSSLLALTDTLYLISEGLSRECVTGSRAVLLVANDQQNLLEVLKEHVYKSS